MHILYFLFQTNSYFKRAKIPFQENGIESFWLYMNIYPFCSKHIQSFEKFCEAVKMSCTDHDKLYITLYSKYGQISKFK